VTGKKHKRDKKRENNESSCFFKMKMWLSTKDILETRGNPVFLKILIFLLKINFYIYFGLF